MLRGPGKAVPPQNLSWPIPTGGYFLDDGAIMRYPPRERFGKYAPACRTEMPTTA